MLELTQIGDVPIRAIFRSPYAMETDVKTKSNAETTVSDGGAIFPSQQYGYDDIEREIDGRIVNKKDNDPYAMLQRLENLIGKPTHAVFCMPFTHDFGRIDALWLVGECRISRIRNTPDQHGGYRVRLDFTLTSSLTPVNRLLWEYVSYDTSKLPTPTTPSSVSFSDVTPFPSWSDYILEYESPRQFYWRYRRENSALMYDASNWDYVVNYLPNEYMQIGLYEPPNSSKGLITVWQDSALFNYRPFVLWSITNFDATYDIDFDVYRPESFGGDETITIDVSVIDSILTTETGAGIQSSDTLIFGDLRGRAAVIRNGAIVSYVSSAFSAYRGGAIGYIALDENQEYRYNYDYLSNAEWASLLIWRMIP